MPEVLTTNPSGKVSNNTRQSVATHTSSLTRSLVFKYYIHDSVPTLRFQLIGDLRTSNIRELNGSWETARTTLNNRRFLLDLSHLFGTDDDGRAWLTKMKDEGAEFEPANYLASSQAAAQPTKNPEQVAAVKLSLLGRVLGLFRRESALIRER